MRGPCGARLPGQDRAVKSAKRHQWRMQRGDFEEVPRLAAATVAASRLARRWAREPRPYGCATRSAAQRCIPPVTALPCRPSLGKGPLKTRDADCHTSDIGHWFAMTGIFARGTRDGGCGLPRARSALAMTVFLWCDVCFFDGFRVYNFRAPCPY